jgi:chemotaxis protein CheD
MGCTDRSAASQAPRDAPAGTARVVAVFQGELAVSADPSTVLTCILGSCVAACLWDPVAQVGGMNHFLLPGRRASDRMHTRFGAYAMEALINEMMHQGAQRRHMRAKAFGGASTFDNAMGIGAANASFMREFLHVEGIPLVAESLGGQQARRIRFYPVSGNAKQMLTAQEALLPGISSRRARRPARAGMPAASGRLELF